jgi:hypothetical protein
LNSILTFTLLCMLIFGLAGCDVQDGRFVTTGDESYPLLSPVGSIDIVDGEERNAALVNDQHLLYILVIAPDIQEHGSSSGSDYGKYVTTLSHTWTTEKGELSVSFSWDRQTDTVTIGKQKFIRTNGDVFVARINTNGEVSRQQLANISPHPNCQMVLQYIQQQLPNDKLISSIQLNK